MQFFWVLMVVIYFSCGDTGMGYDDTAPPEENRFTKVVLTEGMDEPMAMTFLPDGRVVIVERKGGVKAYDDKTGTMTLITTIPVNTKYTNKEGQTREAEEGLMGVIAHPKFAENNWIYMYYADPEDKKHVLARWELHGDSLYADTKKVMLEVPTQREECCHTGGGMVFDKEGNLYLTVGNNTVNPPSGTSNLDERPGHENSDDQRAPGNTNDLRGKILRIHPEDDGSYTIPKGNLFPEGTEKTRPEIYTMGHRNPWRVSIDNETGYIYWGEVGPDASIDTLRGPMGYDEFNQAKQAGFFGWPYFIADNKPYRDFNYETGEYGELFDPEHPINDSPNNTGLRELPPAQKAFIWYPYGPSAEFPMVGSSGRSATGGPVFRKADFKGAKRPFPSYYEGKWFIVEFMRGWIMVVTMDENGDYKSMERFLPNENFSSAIDMQFGPEGDLYVLEYGSAWFRGNENSRLVRVEYNAGNRKPVVLASADKLAGATPLTVQLSSEGTIDYDKYDTGKLKYEWKITSSTGKEETLKDANPTLTLNEAGVYKVVLTVTDTKGESNSQTLEIKAGNEPPVVAIDILKGNKTFFFPGQSLEYAITVNDKEDGSVENGMIPENEVAVNFDYVQEGFDPIAIAQNHRASESLTGAAAGLNLINTNDCKSCHTIDTKSIGPSYLDVAQKYKGDARAVERLADKVINGGVGVWGEHAMSAHPQLSQQDAQTMVRYILSLSEQPTTVAASAPLPLKGAYITTVPEGENGKGGYLLRAAYNDKGTSAIPSLSSEALIPLRNPTLDPEKADVKQSTDLMITPSRSFFMMGDGSYLGYKQLDLTGIQQIKLNVQARPRAGAAGGTIEIRLDAPDGQLLAQTDFIESKDVDFRKLFPNWMDMDRETRQRVMAELGAVPVRVQPTEGIHDVYFVFKNPGIDASRILMQVQSIQFQNSVPPVEQ